MRFPWMFVRRFLAAGTRARIDVCHLMQDMLGSEFGMPQALEVVTRAKGRTFTAGMLRQWEAALARGTDDFAVEVARWVPPSEAIVFFALGRADAARLFAAAAKLAEIRSVQVRAVRAALGSPIMVFVGNLVMTWFIGAQLMPQLAEMTDPAQWDVFSKFLYWFSTGFYENDILIACIFAGLVVAVWQLVLRWTGRGRELADRFAPFSLYRVLSGSGFLFVCIEYLRLGVDLNEQAFMQFERGASRYVRSRMRSIGELMLGEGLNFGQALEAGGKGFPDAGVASVAGAISGREGWEDSLAGFVARWVERSEAQMRARTVALNWVLTGLGMAQTLLIFWASFDITLSIQTF